MNAVPCHIIMTAPTTLSLLLEGVHYQRRDQVEAVMTRIRDELLTRSEACPVSSIHRPNNDLASVVRLLLESHPQLASEVHPEDKSVPLHQAAAIGNVAVAKLLLEKVRHACTGRTPSYCIVT